MISMGVALNGKPVAGDRSVCSYHEPAASWCLDGLLKLLLLTKILPHLLLQRTRCWGPRRQKISFYSCVDDCCRATYYSLFEWVYDSVFWFFLSHRGYNARAFVVLTNAKSIFNDVPSGTSHNTNATYMATDRCELFRPTPTSTIRVIANNLCIFGWT